MTLPVPIRQVRPSIEEAKAERIEGTVMIECVVTSEGNVSQLNVVRTLDPRLDAAATAALEEWRFKPGTKDGVAVAVRVQIEMTFTLK